MLKKIQETIDAAIINIEHVKDQLELENLKIALLGKKGKFTAYLKNLGTIPLEQRPALGELVNFGKQTIQEHLARRKQALAEIELQAKLLQDQLDLSLPGIGMEPGNLHPVTQTLRKVADLFGGLGFDLVDGPEVEDEYHNFDALNIPCDHPARAMHDTFYLMDGKLLRTHTSAVQVRIMQKLAPPYRLLSLGKVYRCDSDLTHTPMFHQIEGLLVDQGINFGHLIGILTQFLRAFFGKPELQIRFRPSYFPFTEPSAEVDMQCVACSGAGCRICKNSGWLEILGCGMVHPAVFEQVDLDPAKYTGWAFGIGADRLAMLNYGIGDLRSLFENDLKFLQQF